MNSTKNDRITKLIDTITLASVEGIGPRRFYDLVGAFGDATAVLRATPDELARTGGIGPELAANIIHHRNPRRAESMADKITRLGWKFFLHDDPDYPQPLKNIYDRPPFLFYQGEYLEMDNRALAVVGSRAATEEGRAFAENIAVELAGNGLTVVSGMARGIDTAAHRGALKKGGRTIAVFGSSLDIIYPPEARRMAEKIAASGCICSEYLPGTRPLPPHFPRRNRIISGLSQGVVVVEAGRRSGALSTAGHALAQNREIFAVPGSPRKAASLGTNQLIKDGARLITSIDDIFSELPRLAGPSGRTPTPPEIDLTGTERSIVELCSHQPIHIDNLARQMQAAVPDVMPVLLALELKGLIKELSGKRFILN